MKQVKNRKYSLITAKLLFSLKASEVVLGLNSLSILACWLHFYNLFWKFPGRN